MNKSLLTVFLLLCLLPISAMCQNEYAIGLGGGIDHKGYFRQDLYFSYFNGNGRFEVTGGFSHRRMENKAIYDNDYYIDGLKLDSWSLYADASWYPSKVFFVGLRLDIISLNWLSRTNSSEYCEDYGRLISCGPGISFKPGLRFRLTKNSTIKIYSLVGCHIFRDPESWEMDDDGDYYGPSHVPFDANLNFSLEYRF